VWIEAALAPVGSDGAVSLLHSFRFLFRSRASLHLEILPLRNQLAAVNRIRRSRIRLTATDRMLWSWLSRTWHCRRSALHIVRLDRRRLALTWLSSLLDLEEPALRGPGFRTISE
jgi:hypothetical protein